MAHIVHDGDGNEINLDAYSTEELQIMMAAAYQNAIQTLEFTSTIASELVRREQSPSDPSDVAS